MTAPGTKGPWAYRPNEYDDWGTVRGPEGDGEMRLRPLICQVRHPYCSEEELNEHRRNKTDPWGANAHLAAAAPCMFDALEAMIGRVEHAANMFHNSQQWHEEDAPDGSGTMWDWVFAPAHSALSRARGEIPAPLQEKGEVK